MTGSEWTIIESVPGYMSKDECAWLMELASTVNSWIEIGVYCGRSSMAVAWGLKKNASLTLIDSNPQSEFWTTLERIRLQRPDLHIAVLEMDSGEAKNHVADVDVVFIDGDHGYEQVLDDIMNYRRRTNLLCGHDYCPEWPGVFGAVNQLCAKVSNPVGSIWIEERK